MAAETAETCNNEAGQVGERAGGAVDQVLLPASTTRQLLGGVQAVQSRRAALYSRLSQGFRSLLTTNQEEPFRKLLLELTDAFTACSREVIDIETALKVGRRADLAASLRRVQEAERDKLRYTLTWQALKQAATTLAEAPAGEDLSDAATTCGGGHAALFERDGHVLHAAANGVSTSPANGDASTAAAAATTTAMPSPDDGPLDTAVAGVEGEVDPALLLLMQHQQRSRLAHGATHRHGAHGDVGGTSGGSSSGGCGCGVPPPAPTEDELSAAMGEALQLVDKAIGTVNDVLEELRYELDELPVDE